MSLYSILDLGYVQRDKVAQTAWSLCSGKPALLQLRAKGHEEEEILAMALEIQPICQQSGVPFIINDYPEIAAEAQADGVHIGQDDGDLDEARKRAGDCAIVGRSTHSVAQATAAQDEGADYIGFGPLHATATKPGRPAIGLEEIADVHQLVKIPIFCIGGITLENLPTVIACGAQKAVIVSDLLQSDDIPAYIARAQALLNSQT